MSGCKWSKNHAPGELSGASWGVFKGKREPKNYIGSQGYWYCAGCGEVWFEHPNKKFRPTYADSIPIPDEERVAIIERCRKQAWATPREAQTKLL